MSKTSFPSTKRIISDFEDANDHNETRNEEQILKSEKVKDVLLGVLVELEELFEERKNINSQKLMTMMDELENITGIFENLAEDIDNEIQDLNLKITEKEEEEVIAEINKGFEIIQEELTQIIENFSNEHFPNEEIETIANSSNIFTRILDKLKKCLNTLKEYGSIKAISSQEKYDNLTNKSSTPHNKTTNKFNDIEGLNEAISGFAEIGIEIEETDLNNIETNIKTPDSLETKDRGRQ